MPSTVINRVQEPPYYHREYKNDVSETPQERSWMEQTKRVALVSLPFFSLYSPLSRPISLAMGGLRTFSTGLQLYSSLQHGNSDEIILHLLQATIATASLAGTIFAHPLGMLITTSQDLIIEANHLVSHLQTGHYQQALECCANILNNALYLGLFLNGGLELSIASYALQILLGLYHSQSEFDKENYLEGAGHVLMAGIRGKQMYDVIQVHQYQHKLEALLNRIKQAAAADIQNIETASIKYKNNFAGGTLETSTMEIKFPNTVLTAQSSLISEKVSPSKTTLTAKQFTQKFQALLQNANSKPESFLELIKNGNDFKNEKLEFFSGMYSDHYTPLEYVIESAGNGSYANHTAAIALLDSGIYLNPNLILSNYSPSGRHLCYNQNLLIKKILTKSINETLIDVNLNNGYLFWIAVQRFPYQDGWVEVTDALIKNGYDINRHKNIFECSRYGLLKRRLFEYLLKHGADLNSFDGGFSILQQEIMSDSESAIWLISKGADPKLITPKTGQTCLHLAARCGSLDLVALLLLKGLNPTLCDLDGNSALHSAAYSTNGTDIIKLLLKNQLNINQTNAKGETALYCAAASGVLGNVQTLVNQGANVKTTPSPLEIAINNHCHDIVKYLVEKGAV